MNTKLFELKNSIYYEYMTAEICLEENQKYKSDPLIVGFVSHVRNKIRDEYDYINKASVLDYILPIIVFTIIGIPIYFCYKIAKIQRAEGKRILAIQKIQIAIAEYQKILEQKNYKITFEKNTMLYRTGMQGCIYNFKIESHGESVRKIPGENNEQINFYIQKMVERFENSQYVTTMIQFDNALKQQYQVVNVNQNNMQQIQGRTVIEMNSIQPAAPIA